MIITRNIINSRIIYKDFIISHAIRDYSFSKLSSTIDAIKNFLINKFDCKPGERILIGTNAGLLQTAIIFAAAELGLIIVVVDYRRKDWDDVDYIDPKTKMLMPIDYFVTDLDEKKFSNIKISWFSHIATNTLWIFDDIQNNKIVITSTYKGEAEKTYTEELADFTPNNIINATPDSLFMICTSSGTTGTPKVIQHSHEFIYSLINRNKSFYYGNVGVTINLQHGSSFATYFLPAIISEKTEGIYNFRYAQPKDYKDYDVPGLDHLMFPYHKMILTFLNSLKRNPNLNLYTLGYIDKTWIESVNRKRVKDIISIFGSNETSGPVFINKISIPNFSETRYLKVDDFYKIKLDEKGSLEVILPVYERSVFTNDIFKFEDDQYIHIGRNDLIRINQVEVDIKKYSEKLKDIINADFIYDTVRQKIYLAVWEESLDLNYKIKEINDFLKTESFDHHNVDKFAVLNQEKFLSGIKLDQELLRDYFRNYHDKKY